MYWKWWAVQEFFSEWVWIVNLLLVKCSQGPSYIKLAYKKNLNCFFFCKFLCLVHLMICVYLNRTKPWLEWSIKFNQYSFQKALVEFNNLWIHLFFKEFNWISMSKILSSPFKWRAEVGAWEVSLFCSSRVVCVFFFSFLFDIFFISRYLTYVS